MTALKVVFAGTPEFALPSLDALLKSPHSLSAIYTQPDRPAGRGRKMQISAVKNWALTHEIPIYQPLDFKSPEAVDELAALQPDVLIVIAYGLILPKRVLTIPRLGCINVHASLLPRWRGASPIQHAIWHGDRHSGVTIMQMDVGMDTGDSLREQLCSVSSTDTAGTLHDKLALLATEPLLLTLNDLARGTVNPKVQDSADATYAGKINKEDAVIQWTQSAEAIERQIRAFNPWPIAWTRMGADILRIYTAKVEQVSSTAPPGTVISLSKSGLSVATGDKVLSLQNIQFAGGKVISIVDYLNSNRTQLSEGLVFQ